MLAALMATIVARGLADVLPVNGSGRPTTRYARFVHGRLTRNALPWGVPWLPIRAEWSIKTSVRRELVDYSFWVSEFVSGHAA